MGGSFSGRNANAKAWDCTQMSIDPVKGGRKIKELLADSAI